MMEDVKMLHCAQGIYLGRKELIGLTVFAYLLALRMKEAACAV